MSIRQIAEALQEGAEDTSADSLNKAMHSCREICCRETSDLDFSPSGNAAFEGMAGMPTGEDVAMSAWERILLHADGKKRPYDENFEVTYQEDDAIVMVRRR